MATLSFQVINDEGDEVTLRLPAHTEVCPRCHGEGKHVNPSIDGNGITESDRMDWADDDFMEAYVAGVYDVPCEECHGANVVLVVDEKRCNPEDLALYQAHHRAIAEMRAEELAERRMGA